MLSVPVIPVRLVEGTAVERQISSGESHAYELELGAGSYLSVAYRQSGIEIAASLLSPDGQPLAGAGQAERRMLKRLAAITPRAGRYRLILTGREPALAHGRYELRIEEMRRARAGDEDRVAARRAFAAGLAIWAEGASGAGDRALVELKAARRLWVRAGDRRGEADAGNEIGNLWFNGFAGPQAEATARTELERALALAREVGYRAGEAKALGYLGQFPAAIEPNLRALALWKEVGDVAEQGEVMSNLGYLSEFYPPRDLARADRWYRDALSLREQAGDLEGQVHTLNGIGLLRDDQRRFDEAVECLERARGLAQRIRDRRVEASIVGGLASIYHNHGELQKAIDLYTLPVLASDAVDPAIRGRNLLNLASLYLELGNLEQAERTYRRLIRLQPSDEDGVLAQIDQGALLFNKRDYPAALAQYQRALESSRSIARKDIESLALAGLGRVTLAMGRPGDARDFLLRALATHAPPDVPTLVALGDAYRTLHDFTSADDRLGEAMALAERSQRPAAIANCLRMRARLDRDRGDLALARREIERALGQIESVRSRVTSDAIRTSYFATQRAFYDLDVELLTRLDRLHPGAGYREGALVASDRSRARGLLDLLAEGKIDVRSGVSQAFKRREVNLAHELAAARNRLAAARATLPPDPREIDSLQTELSSVAQKQEVLEAEIRRQNPRYARVRYPSAMTAPRIQRLLDDQTALLEYYLGENEDSRSYLFVVTRVAIVVHPLPPAKEITERVQRLRQALETPNGFAVRAYLREAAALYPLLVPRGADSKRNLLVVPDGILHLLPFEALLTEEAGNRPLAELPYLLRQHSISYVPSASVLEGLREPRPEVGAAGRSLPPAKSFLAFADPLYRPPPPQQLARGPGMRRLAVSASRLFAPLPHTRSEAEAIAGLFPPSEVELYLGSRATKREVVENPSLKTAQRVHFAVHGFVDEEQPELSGLALTPAGADDDGVLRVVDLFNLELNADLLVLSACETGLGKRLSGEGLVGISRALFYAGAPRLVVSLWQVSEESAPRLMYDFYRQMQDGRGKGEALRRAKLAMIAGGTQAHPFYWAPFVLVGDPK